jgi:hypothetical protein
MNKNIGNSLSHTALFNINLAKTILSTIKALIVFKTLD